MREFHTLEGTTKSIKDGQPAFDVEMHRFLGGFQKKYQDNPVFFHHKKHKDIRQWVIGINQDLINPEIDQENLVLVGKEVSRRHCCAVSYAEFVANGNWRLATAEEIKQHEKDLKDSSVKHQLLVERNDPAVANDKLVKALADERKANAENTSKLIAALEKIASK